MIQRASDYNKINFLDNGKDYSDQVYAGKDKEKKKAEESIESNKAKKLGNTTDSMHSSTILSAGRGIADNSKLPTRRDKNSYQSSIFNPDKISEMATKASNDEKTKLEKENVSNKRKSLKSSILEEMEKNLKDVDTRKAASILSSGTYSGSNHKNKTPIAGNSIFDDSKEFTRIPEKTAGEKISEEAKKRREVKDDSWKKISKNTTTKTIMDNFFDSLNKKAK